MHVSVYSLKNVLYEGEAKSVNCKTRLGEITVLDHHRPLISALTKGIVKIVDSENQEHYIPMGSGFLEVRSNTARLLVDEAPAG